VHCLSRLRLHRPCARLCVVLAASVAGCSASMVENLPNVPGLTPYRVEIQQGNFVSQDMVAKLKRGMSREQVRFVLGSPLLTDMFHANRWDYVFFRERPDRTREERRLSVFFENDRLVRVAGDVVPEGGAPSGAATRGAAVKDDVAKEEPVKDDAAKGEAAKDDAASAPLERAGEKGQ